MRKMIFALMTVMGCFAATAVSAQEEPSSVVSSEESSGAPSEVVVDVSVTDSLHGSNCGCGKGGKGK